MENGYTDFPHQGLLSDLSIDRDARNHKIFRYASITAAAAGALALLGVATSVRTWHN